MGIKKTSKPPGMKIAPSNIKKTRTTASVAPAVQRGPIGRFLTRVDNALKGVGSSMKTDMKSHQYGSVILDALDAPYVVTKSSVFAPVGQDVVAASHAVVHASETALQKTGHVIGQAASATTHAIGGVVKSMEPEIILVLVAVAATVVVAAKVSGKFL